MMVFDALDAAYLYLSPRYGQGELKKICRELGTIAGLNDYAFSGKKSGAPYTYDEVQEVLSKLNEKESIRKSKGVYYTPNDVVRFILRNSILASFGALSPENIGGHDLAGIPHDVFCTGKTVFDPTCGAGEYLLAALSMKLDLLDAWGGPVTRPLLRRTVATIRGNDLNSESVIIAKIRLFLCALSRYGVRSVTGLGAVLNRGFSSCDYVTTASDSGAGFDIIVGNPPYVEDSKSGLTLRERYGNIYANVLVNAASQLAPNGSIGFIVPLSYISTPRMKKLRNELLKKTPEQYILSYADRPDCLFDSVHQKLCIVIGRNTGNGPCIYTGNYQYWYQSERVDLFSRTSVIRNTFWNEAFIPKLGTELDASIYAKVTDPRNMRSVYAHSRAGAESVYLNRRETFWMKAYREPRDDPEYKVFSYETAAEADYCYCLINSSLFWWYWICTSDCWHVSKELNGFMAPPPPAGDRAALLARNLSERLEKTKVYVGTAQTKYEYKHRECVDEIHAIDDFVNELFGLTEAESAYIKSFAYKYRTSGGA